MDPNSQVLSWQVKVAFALANHFNKVVILTHKKQNISKAPSNVKIFEFPYLAKSPYRWAGGEYILNFWISYLHCRYHFDRCFIHMNYRWAYRFAPFFKLSGIPVSIWYAHKANTKYLRAAHYFADKIITSNESGFRMKSDKTSYIGQGIDTELFKIQNSIIYSSNILYVGRISKVKRLEVLVDVLYLLNTNSNGPIFTLTIIGAPLNEGDRKYYTNIQQYIGQKKLTDYVFFKGAVEHAEIPQYYTKSFLHLSFSNTGSMDKSLMESLASGCPILTSNPALFNIINKEYRILNEDPNLVATQVLVIYNQQASINKNALRELIINRHDLSSFIIKLKNEL